MQDVGGAIHSYQQALHQRRLVAHGARRARPALPPHRAVGAADRRADAARRAVDRRQRDHQVPHWKSARSGTCVCSTRARRSPPTRRCSTSIRRTSTALRALEGLYEKTEQTEKYLDVLEAQLDATPSDAERVSLYERMAAAWEERFGKLDRAAEALEKIVAIDNRNYSAYRELARLYQAAGKYEALVETYRNHIMATTDVATRVELYVAMGQVYEERAQGSRSRDRGLQRRPVVRRRRAARARRPRSPLREDQRVGPRHRHDGAPRPADERRAPPGRPVLAHGQDPVRPARRRRGARRRTCSAVSRSTRPRADDGGADQAVLGSR